MNFQTRAAADHRVQIFPWPVLFLSGIWVWTIWSCAEHWQGNPNYSYGWAVPPLAIGFALRRYWRTRGPGPEPARQQDSMSISPRDESVRRADLWRVLVAIGAAAAVFFLEYSREQMWHPTITLWAICLLAVTSTIALLRFHAGPALARSELFPVLFFLTAVPWPPRFEQPIVSALMRWVAATVTEMLHWLGIEAQTSGAAIALRSGLVGISEACSGVRSLQAGIMFGLAMGEWFLLRPARRVALVLLAVILALATNLARTLALSLQAEWHGIDSLDRVHDLIGNITITVLILGIWIAGKFLAPRQARQPSWSIHEVGERISLLFRRIMAPGVPVFRVLAMGFLAGIVCARVLYARLEAQDRTQTSPFFVARTDNSSTFLRLPRDIWNELRPTKAEYIRHQSPDLPGGAADCFHFFWKPSAWNRFVLVHRPDVCMPGVGWTQTAPPEPLDITLSGGSIHCHAFRFQRGNFRAVELWGVWRNGDPVPLEYEPAQALGSAIPPASMHLEGKRRSATEIIACAIISDGAPPSDEIAVALLRSVFQYKRQ